MGVGQSFGEAFAKAQIDAKIRLVLTGDPAAEIAECVDRNHAAARVHFVGVVPEIALPSLYRGAEALIFPSLYEGFGLPVLEAMACGTPVVTANITAMPETAGDAALLVDPTSVEQIRAAIEQIVSDTSLRQRLLDKGVTQAAQFSWVSTAAKVRELFGEV